MYLYVSPGTYYEFTTYVAGYLLLKATYVYLGIYCVPFGYIHVTYVDAYLGIYYVLLVICTYQVCTRLCTYYTGLH